MPVSAVSVGGQCEVDVHVDVPAAARGGLGPLQRGMGLQNQPDVPITAFRINDQTTGRTFAAPASQQRNISSLHSYTAKLSWVTGSHTLSGGLNGNLGSYRVITTRGNGDVSLMRYGNIGVGAPGADATGYGPNQVTLNLPTDNYNKIDGDNGFWMTDRMDVQAGDDYRRPAVRLVHGVGGRLGHPAEQVGRLGDIPGVRRRAELEGPQSRGLASPTICSATARRR